MDDARNLLQDFLDEMEKEETLLLAVVDADEKFIGSTEMYEMLAVTNYFLSYQLVMI